MSDSETIQQVILDLYRALGGSDEAAFSALVHPQVRTVNIGNSNEVHVFTLDQIVEFTINGLKRAVEQIPGFYARWDKIEFINVTVQDVTAAVEVRYQMAMPDSTGFHQSFIHLVKEDGRWLVINIIDRGIEKAIDDANA
jgi:hypothetical protein